MTIKADAWLYYHSYNSKASQDMVGRDTTDEVTTFVLLRPQRSTLLTGRQATFSKDSATNDSLSVWNHRWSLEEFCSAHSRWQFPKKQAGIRGGRGSISQEFRFRIKENSLKYFRRCRNWSPQRRSFEHPASFTSMSSETSSTIPGDLAFLDSQTKQDCRRSSSTLQNILSLN
jgi:hypothetical protein